MRRARRSLPGLLALLALGGPLAAPATSAPWARLGAEARGSYRWSVEATMSGAAQGPCLEVAASWRSGPLEYHRSAYRECAPSASLRRSGPPLIASAGEPSTGAPARVSAIGMIFAPAARHVRLTLAGGRTETVRLRKLDPAQAGAVGLPSFRYAAFAIRGAWCAERLLSLGAGGAVLWDSGVDRYACGREGDPHFVARSG